VSYLRGRYYAYCCGDGEGKEFIDLHGDQPGCSCGEHEKTPALQMPIEVFDALVLMRHAEMTERDKMRAVVYALDHGRGNGGSGNLLDGLGARSYYDEEARWLESLSSRYTFREKPRPVHTHRRKAHGKHRRRHIK
jgi:hypothetical protein